MSDIGRPLSAEELSEYHSCVGGVIQSWAVLESALVLTLAILLGNFDQFRARTIWMSMPNFRARSALLKRLAASFVTDDTALKEFVRLMKTMKRMAEQRNMLAHGIGPQMDSRNRVVLVVDKGDGEGPVKFGERNAVQLKAMGIWAAEMRALGQQLLALNVKLDQHISSWPQRSPSPSGDPNP